ncbi:IclR family transcriptional regulator [Rhizobium oryzicola]|uniref:IclR family transcriptional regulator n=1 Tax=Rhizobium oryzicola TaxID=1232668 RepID=A0ABT8ST31_9HYPH|nr:IclR family transcriptional regulator [Rhizobium oryzicola]MDO1581193.1 IclR family transcriptional regulator [Rhizobium oryzicola]
MSSKEDEKAPEIDKLADTGTLGKAIALLDLVTRAPEPLRFTDILKLTGLPRGSLHRQLRHLVLEGLLDDSPDGTYGPGLRLLEFASRAWAKSSFREVAAPHLLRLHQQTGETVHLGVLRGHEIIYLDKVEGRQALRLHSQIGKASPVYCTGIGKAALSVVSDELRAEILSALCFEPFTPGTHKDVAALLEDLQKIKSAGFAFDMEEHEIGIRCVAAPISSNDAAFASGISITAPAFRASPEQLKAWAPLVLEAAHAIQLDIPRRLGPAK